MSPNIVIVGAGFVGVRSAKLLRQRLGPSARITLVDDKDHFLFTPRLIDALSGNPSPFARASLITLSKKHRFIFLQGHVTSIDRQQKMVHLDNQKPSLSYDFLVLSHGAQTRYFHIPGAESYSFPLKTIHHVERIHAQIDNLLEKAAATSDAAIRRHLLNFVVVGGGLTGIESVFALQQYIQHHLCQNTAWSSLASNVSLSVIQGTPQILPGFSQKIVLATLRALKKANIDLHVSELITQVDETQITTATGQVIPTHFVLWCGGLEPRPLSFTPAIHHDPAGFMTTDAFLRVCNTIFAAGDAISYRDQNVTIPKNAQTAFLMADAISQNIVRTIQQKPLKSFHYTSKGNLILLGQTGVCDLKSFVIQSRFVRFLRDRVYRHRYHQIT